MMPGMKVRHPQIEEAVEVFVRGFCAGKSRTHPYEAIRIANMWVMRDAPRRNSRDYRKEEWVAYGVEPAAADAAAREHRRGRYFVCAILETDQSDESLRAEYKRLGYRLLAREGLFRHRLERIPRAGSPVPVRRVRTAAVAERLAKATRSRPIPTAMLGDDAPFRQYVATDGDDLVGWVRSVRAGASTWCSDMYVRPTHRRRGIGRAMMAKMLRDDRTHGSKQSVLLASKAGSLLYPHLGYEQLGTLFIFAPVKK